MAKLTIRIWLLIIFLLIALLMISPSFQKGIEIKTVEKNSSAYESGLRPGMKLQQVNSKEIKTLEEYALAIEKAFENENENETRLSIATDKGEFIFLTDNPGIISVKEISRSRLKTGLDLSGGARALVKPENVSLSDSEINDLVSITSNRLNAFGLTDLTVRSVKDLSGNNYMLIEIAGATPSDLKELVGKQGKFEAKIGNKTVFQGGQEDIKDVCRNAECSGILSCSSIQSGQACGFRFVIYLNIEAAQRHAETTKNLSLDETGQYLSEKLYLYVDDIEMDSLLISSGLRGQATTEIAIEGSGSGNTREEAYKNAKDEMAKLQTILLTGSLPYKLEIVKLDTISPFLGEEFTKALITLGIVVFIIISFLVFIKYRKIKITLAVILTMFSEAFITLGIASFINWNLDAPSIAGIIAGMGTGINDQIIILDESKTYGTGSIKDRIKRALFIIIGAFFTIVAAMLPLFWAGAGMLRGFALTTIIGVTVGILITRPAFADIVKKIGE